MARAAPKFRGLSPRRARKIAKILALRGFSHSLDLSLPFKIGSMKEQEAR
jgi:hypothetical protein